MSKPRNALKLVLLLLTLALAGTTPAFGQSAAAAATPQFKVLALYSGTFDAAHISFEKEANVWFPRIAAANNFSYTSSTNWDMLDNLSASQFQVVMFLDDAPQTAAQRTGFQHYMQNGGAWFG